MDKCKIKGQIVDPCSKLLWASEIGNPTSNKKGIFRIETRNTTTLLPQRVFFGAKSGDFKKDGVSFDFCPFCGKNIKIKLLKWQTLEDKKTLEGGVVNRGC